jgi:hypothetical protein
MPVRSLLQYAHPAEKEPKMSERDGHPGFAPDHDVPIPYMQRIREYYQGLGYGAPYRWAHYAEGLFSRWQSRSPSAGSR